MIVIRIHMICQLSDRPLRRIFFVLNFALRRRMMKKIVLMLGIVICIAYESSAETWNCGPATNGVYSDSVQCTYDEATKTLTISGEGEMGNYSVVNSNNPVSTAPWFGKNIEHAVFEGNVTSIGAGSFFRAYKLTDITGLENITRIGGAAFEEATKLKSIDLPNVQEIGGVAFKDAHSLEYAGIPEDVTYKPDGCSKTPTPAVCGHYRNWDTFVNSGISNCRITGDCGSCGEKVIQSGAGCVNSCYSGYTSYYGYCYRTRYTLPEADEATSNDNENMIEWIFE